MNLEDYHQARVHYIKDGKDCDALVKMLHNGDFLGSLPWLRPTKNMNSIPS